MTWHVVVQAGADDGFMPVTATNDSILHVPLGVSGAADAVSLSVADTFAQWSVTPVPAAVDLLLAAIGAYTADIRIARQTGYDGWTRDITLYLPVQNMIGWEIAVEPFERLLTFLTGDHWSVVLRAAITPFIFQPPHPPRSVSTLVGDTVSLFSGGLDSFIGAADQLAQGKPVNLVGHHSQGGGPTSSSQSRALAALRLQYSKDETPFLRLWVSPPKGKGRSSEITTRGRSVLFLALGVSVASAVPNGKLLVPENGVISLNVPLTTSRLGSLSTRTTHPYLIALLRKVLAALGLNIGVNLPYKFKTKGELLAECPDKTTVKAGIAATMSCARPNASRFSGHGNQHCGYCLPCLIRRAAITGAFGSDPTLYTKDVLRETLSIGRMSDLRAVRMALARYKDSPPRITDVLIPGPLPASDVELREYLGVFERGIQELRQLLH